MERRPREPGGQYVIDDKLTELCDHFGRGAAEARTESNSIRRVSVGIRHKELLCVMSLPDGLGNEVLHIYG